MKQINKSLMHTLVPLALTISPAHAGIFDVQDPTGTCLTEDFLLKSDADFAASCAEFAFGDQSTLQGRETLAWMFFSRVNQLIKGTDANGKPVTIPRWMAWPTDDDTFKDSSNRYTFSEVPDLRSDISPVIPKHVLAGFPATADPDGANEEVTRNQVGYDYLFDAKLNTVDGVQSYLSTNSRVEMPIGSIEIKGSWLKAEPEFIPHFPEGTFTFDFEGGTYFLRGMHIMTKMAVLPKDADIFSTEAPSWFWTTFELNDNPGGSACTDEKCDQDIPLQASGTAHVREDFITQRAPYSQADVTAWLNATGIGGMGFENYAPNGTQIRFTVEGEGQEAVILGHTDMEDFAGWIKQENSPSTHQRPADWTRFDASCHTCHATAAFNPSTGYVFPFSVPVGALPNGYSQKCNVKDGNGGSKEVTANLNQGYKSLDFMWPIAFQLDFECKFASQ